MADMTAVRATASMPARWAPAYLARGAFLASLLLVVSPVPARGGGFVATEALVWSRLAFFAMLVCSSVLVVVLNGRLSPLRRRRRLLLVAGVLQCVSGLGYPLVNAGVLPEAMLTTDLLLQAAVLPLINVGWGEAYAALDERRCLQFTAGSLAVAAVLVAAYHWLPQAAATVLSFLFPASVLALLWLLRSVPETSYRKPPASWRAVRPSWRFVVGTLCALAAANVLAGSAERGQFIGFSSVVAGMVAGSVMVGLLLLVGRRRPVRLAVFDVGALLVLVTCYAGSGLVMALEGFSAMGCAPAVRAFQHTSVMALEQCMCAGTWLILLETVRRTRVNPVFVVGLGFAAIFAGKAIGSVVGMAAPLDPAALSILALFLFVPAVLCLGVDAFTVDAPEPSRIDEGAFDLRSFGAAYGLTPREQEVLELWVPGNQLDYVAEQLSVSKNTAKTHVTHIYRKAGVSTREELLGLLRRRS